MGTSGIEEMKGYAIAQRNMLLNALNCNIPYKYIREMIYGNKEPEAKEEHPVAESLDITEELASTALKILQQYIHNTHGDCGKCICARENDGRCWIGGCEEPETDAPKPDTKNGQSKNINTKHPDTVVKSFADVNTSQLKRLSVAVFEFPDDYPRYCVGRMLSMQNGEIRETDIIILRNNLAEIRDDVERSIPQRMAWDARVREDNRSFRGIWI